MDKPPDKTDKRRRLGSLESEPVLAGFLLQRHRVFLAQRQILRLTGRTIFLAGITACIFATLPTPPRVFVTAVGVWFAMLWVVEDRMLGLQLTQLEHMIARRGEEGDEDFYIEFRHSTLERFRYAASIFSVLRAEPFGWLILLSFTNWVMRSIP